MSFFWGGALSLSYLENLFCLTKLANPIASSVLESGNLVHGFDEALYISPLCIWLKFPQRFGLSCRIYSLLCFYLSFQPCDNFVGCCFLFFFPFFFGILFSRTKDILLKGHFSLDSFHSAIL